MGSPYGPRLFFDHQWIDYTPGAKCWPTWYNFTFTNGQTVEAVYTAKGSYNPNQCYFTIKKYDRRRG
jgi:hypothetical protein